MFKTFHSLQLPTPTSVLSGSLTFTFCLSVLSCHSTLVAGRNPSQQTNIVICPTSDINHLQRNISVCTLTLQCIYSDCILSHSECIVYLLWPYNISTATVVSPLYMVSLLCILSPPCTVSPSLFCLHSDCIMSPICILSPLCVVAPLWR